MGKKETYYAWLRGEDRRGWIQHKKAMYMLNKKRYRKAFWLYFQMYQNKKEDEIQVGPLTEVTKKRFADYRVSY